jgi:hypothetical protein
MFEYDPNTKASIGIDNGLAGAFVVNINGAIADVLVMPTLKQGKYNVVDARKIGEFITIWNDRGATFFLEQASMHSPGKMALCSTWRTFGTIDALLKYLKCPYEDVPPQKWQKHFWVRPKMPKGVKFDTKAAALAAASRKWPKQTWLATPRSSVPHDGIVDAALIAEYGRIAWRL